MKFAVIDLEGTTKEPKIDEFIVEIGIVEVDFLGNHNKILFNEVIKEKNFSEEKKNAWIFEQRANFFYEVWNKGKDLQSIYKKLQQLLNDYCITSYNEAYDFTFLELKGFQIPYKLPCMMLQQHAFLKKKRKKEYVKWPSFQETWDYYFPNTNYSETHEAIDDASHEAKVLIEMVRNNSFPKYKFSSELDEIYSDSFKSKIIKKKKNNKIVHGPQNEEDALIYLNQLFPLHIAKNRCLIRKYNCISTEIQSILIIDIGCGPFTFTQSVLEELNNSKRDLKKKIEIKICGFDKEREILIIGADMVERWKKNLPVSWTVENKSYCYEFTRYDSIISTLTNSINDNKSQTIFIGFSSVFSSKLPENQFLDIFKVFDQFQNHEHIYCFISEPEKNELIQIPTKFQKLSPTWRIVQNALGSATSTKPEQMNYEIPFICTNFRYHFLHKHPLKEISKSKIRSLRYYKQFIFLYSKARNFQMKQRFTDFIDLKIYDIFLKKIFKRLKRKQVIEPPTLFKFESRKGIHPFKYRNISHIPMDNMIYSCAFLDEFGNYIDKLFSKSIFGSRIAIPKKTGRIYEHFTKGYHKFTTFELLNPFENSFYKADIKNFFPSVDIIILKRKLELIFQKMNFAKNSSEIFIDLLGQNIDGLPIQHPLSPFLANCFLLDLDIKLNESNKISCYARYMDDYKISFNDFPQETEVKSYLKQLFIQNDVELNCEKFKHLSQANMIKILNYNAILTELSKGYFQIINPLKNGILLFIQKNKIHSITDKVKNYLKCFEKVILFNGIKWDLKNITRFFHLGLLFLKKNNINDQTEEKYFILPDISAKMDLATFNDHFKKNNEELIKQKDGISQLLMTLLQEEIKELNKVYIDLIKLERKDIEKSEKQQIIKEHIDLRESEEHIMRIRKVRFLIYKLIKIRHKYLEDGKNQIIKKISRYYKIGLPLRTIFALLYSYNHIDILEKFFNEKTNEKDICSLHNYSENTLDLEGKYFYADDYSRILNYISLYYIKNGESGNISIKDLVNDFEFKFPIEKISILEYLILLNHINEIDYSDLKRWLMNNDNYFVVKNLCLCIIMHDNYNSNKIEGFNLIKSQLNSSKFKDKIGIDIILKNQEEIKKKLNKDYVEKDFFLSINSLPKGFDIDYEFWYLMDNDDSYYQDEDYL